MCYATNNRCFLDTRHHSKSLSWTKFEAFDSSF